MNHNFVFPSIVEALPIMLTNLEDDGHVVGSRVGTTKELTHVGITLLEPWNREILVKDRKPNLAAQIAETMWVLAGRDDIAWLENYLPRVRDFSDDGETWRAGYGARLRRWEDHGHAKTIDQWRWLVQHLSDQPESRRAVMSIWDPAIDTADGKDIPCNDWLSFLGRNGRLDLHVAIRSNDVIWGWSGINQFEWSALLEITAAMTGMECGALHFSTTSFHLYDHHFAKAEKIRTSRLPDLSHVKDSPRFDASVVNHDFDALQRLLDDWFRLEYDIRTGSPLVQHYVDTFPEPMLRSWLRIIQWWWSQGVRQAEYLEPLAGTRLEVATDYAMQPKRPARTVEDALRVATALISEGGHVERIKKVLQSFGVARVSDLKADQAEEFLKALEKDPTPPFNAAPGRVLLFTEQGGHQSTLEVPDSPFLANLCALHLEKEAAYGGSWKKRGELFSILPNVGRKVDRLGTGGETEDETSADTAGDLFVYLAKYLTFLEAHAHGTPHDYDPSDFASEANKVMRRVEWDVEDRSVPDLQDLVTDLVAAYEDLLVMAEKKSSARVDVVRAMLPAAYMLARTLWEREQASEGRDEYRGADVD